MSFADYLSSQPKWWRTTLALLGVLAVGFLDYITGYRISFFLFYAGPILFGVWYLDQKLTTLIVLISAIVWWWADWQDGHPYFASWVQIWETAMRLGFFSFVAIGGTAIKARRDSMEAVMTEIRRRRELERDIVVASEHEQQRIGADLHDGLCQYLAGITCVAGSLRDDLEERFLPEAETAAELHELLRDSVVQARNIARGMAPVHMDDAGLTSALDELAIQTHRLHDVDCTLESDEEVLIEEIEIATNLYRIAQEAISNAVRHGRATRISLALAIDGDRVCLTVRDNGTGIPSADHPGRGMGLRTMQYRADILNASFEIVPMEGGGTRVSCRAPLTTPTDPDSIHAN